MLSIFAWWPYLLMGMPLLAGFVGFSLLILGIVYYFAHSKENQEGLKGLLVIGTIGIALLSMVTSRGLFGLDLLSTIILFCGGGLIGILLIGVIYTGFHSPVPPSPLVISVKPSPSGGYVVVIFNRQNNSTTIIPAVTNADVFPTRTSAESWAINQYPTAKHVWRDQDTRPESKTG